MQNSYTSLIERKQKGSHRLKGWIGVKEKLFVHTTSQVVSYGAYVENFSSSKTATNKPRRSGV